MTSTTEENLAVKLTPVSEEIFDDLILEDGTKITEIDKSGNKVLLFFVGSLGCPFCSGTMEDIFGLYDTLVKMRIVPVIVHYENDQVYTDFIYSSERTMRYKDIPHCSRSVAVNKAFNLAKTDVMGMMYEVLQGAMAELGRLKVLGITPGKVSKFGSPATKPLLAAVFVVKDSRVVCEFRKERKYQRFDLAKIALDPDGFGIQTDLNLMKRSSFRTLLPKRSFRDFDAEPVKPIERSLKKTSSFSLFKTNMQEIKAENIPMKEILASDNYRSYFKLFCATEYSPENILFWESVIAFRSCENYEEKAKEMFDVFFESKSDMEINIDSHTKKLVIERMEKPDSDMFNVVSDRLVGTCIADQYFRFILSSYYEQMIEKKKKPSNFLLFK